MAEKEPIKWVTINGKHVPIYEDGTPGYEKQNEDKPAKTRKEKEQEWNEKVDDYIKKMVDNSQVKAGKPTQMSSKVFKASIYSVLNQLEKGDVDYTMLSNLTGYDKENEYVNSKQTMSGIQTLINERIDDAKLDFKIGVIDNARFNREIKALRIIQNTLNDIKKRNTWL